MNKPEITEKKKKKTCFGNFYALQYLKITSAGSLGFFEEVRQLANSVFAS